MSIATEIQRLQQAKADIAEAIVAKGGEVSGTIDTYAQAIEALPSGEQRNYIEGIAINQQSILMGEIYGLSEPISVNIGDRITFRWAATGTKAMSISLLGSTLEYLNYYSCNQPSGERTITLSTSGTAYVMASFMMEDRFLCFVKVNDVVVWQPNM